MTKAPRVRNGCRIDGTTRLATGACLTEQQAREIFAQGEEAVVFALLALAKLAAQGNPASDSNSHAAPSGMKPPHLKPRPRASERRNRAASQATREHAVQSRRPSVSTPAKNIRPSVVPIAAVR